jgi:hypothetical protein
VFELAREDLDFFAALALPMVTRYRYPKFYKYLWGLLRSKAILTVRDFSKFALGLPRGFAKTSYVKLFILWMICFSQKRFFLYIGNTAHHAENAIADIATMLDDPNIKAVFGDWRISCDRDARDVKKFSFRGREVIIAAIGQGGSVRGLNIDNARPDVMVFDDIQSREDAESRTISNQIETWMFGTAMEAAAHYGCLYIFIANMYPTPHSLLRKLKGNSEWVKLIVGGILLNGTSLWEELKPLEQLLGTYRHLDKQDKLEIFKSEILNDEEASLNTNIDLSKVPPYPYDAIEEKINAGTFVIIDPSNDKENSDNVAICGFMVVDGKPVCIRAQEGKHSPMQIIMEGIRIAMEIGSSLVVIEANAFQYSLLYWSNYVCESYGITGIVFQPIYSGSRSKNARILDMFKSLLSEEILLAPATRSIIFSQARSFQPLKKNNVDNLLDCLTYAPRVLTEFPELISINSRVVTGMDGLPARIGSVAETCCF